MDEAVAQLRAQAFALLEQLRAGTPANARDLNNVLVDLQGVANQLGAVEALLLEREKLRRAA